MTTAPTLSHATRANARTLQPPLDLSRSVHSADWTQLPETLRRRFSPQHGPARYAADMRFDRSVIGAVFAVLAMPFRAPLPLHDRIDLPVVVDVRSEGEGVV